VQFNDDVDWSLWWTDGAPEKPLLQPWHLLL
jgi:hypothetical protein